MSKDTVIHDVGKVLIKKKSDGRVFGSAVTQLTSLAQQIQEDFLKAGWGNADVYTIRSDKSLSGNIRNAFFNLEFMAMIQGVSIENNKITIWEEEKLTVKDGKVTLKTLPIDTIALRNEDGEYSEMDVITKVVDIPSNFASDGEKVTIHYPIEADAETVQISAENFSENYYLEIHTIEYDPKTAKVFSDLYIQLPKVTFSGEFDMSLEAGQVYTPEFGYKALSEDGDIGQFARVKREKEEVVTPPTQPDEGANDGDLGA
ncbi:hypothetical protein [Bacillus pumilus]|uniref:hypothetical protein n=1 Tax=Bacillus pumilus TaxID=1408 RepID=UPI001C23C542|nr:hypothetical protein [Bacillus pumilus]MBU8607773.1 hypothetical protein [Bacillus pumilus]